MVAPAAIALLFAVSTPGALPSAATRAALRRRGGRGVRGARSQPSIRRACREPSRARGPPAGTTRPSPRLDSERRTTPGRRTWPISGGVSSATSSRSCPAAPTRPSSSSPIETTQERTCREADNATGTAALIELAKGFAPQELGPDPQPQHTLVFVSTDAGVYGGAGARRFGETSPYAGRAVAAVVLDDLGSGGGPELSDRGGRPRLVGASTRRHCHGASRGADGHRSRVARHGDTARRPRRAVCRSRAGPAARGRHRNDHHLDRTASDSAASPAVPAPQASRRRASSDWAGRPRRSWTRST